MSGCELRTVCAAWVARCDENADEWSTSDTNLDCFEPYAASGEAVSDGDES